MSPTILNVNCPFKDVIMNVFKEDSVQFVLYNNTNYDVYDDEIDRYFLFFDSNLKDRLKNIPKDGQCSIFVKMSSGIRGESYQKQWENIAKLSVDMFPHCILPYTDEEDIKDYFVIKPSNESMREKQLKLIERMSWYETLIDGTICEKLLDTFGNVTNILKSDKQTMMDVLGTECEFVIDAIQEFIQAKQDYYIQ